jgi:hypothetical protein
MMYYASIARSSRLILSQREKYLLPDAGRRGRCAKLESDHAA